MAASSPRPADARGRRSRRPWRLTASAALLIAAVVVAAIALITLATPALVVASIVAPVLGGVAGWMMRDEIRAVRHDWARDRTALADAGRRDAKSRSREQIAFADLMASRVADARDRVLVLSGELEQARAEVGTQTRRALTAERSARDLTERLDSAHAELRELQEALAASEDAAFDAQAQLLAARDADVRRRTTG